MVRERQSQETVQEEIKSEDRKFLAGGIFFVIGGGLLLLLLVFILLRFVLFPLFRSVMGAFNRGSTDITSTSTPTPEDNSPILKDIDAVPYNWQRSDLEEIGISLAYPPEGTISAKGNTAELKLDNARLLFAQKSLTEDDLEDEVQKIRNDLNDTDDSTLVEKASIASLEGYAFTVESSKEQHVFIPQKETNYIEIIVPDLSNDNKKRAIVDDILASIELISDKSPLDTNR